MNADVYDMAHAQGALVGAVHPFDKEPDRLTIHHKETPTNCRGRGVRKTGLHGMVGFSDHKATAQVWYKLLNLGFRIPAGAGTDATANYAAPIRGQVGIDRVYAWVPGWPRPRRHGLKR